MTRTSALEQARVAIEGRDFARFHEIIDTLLKQRDLDTVNILLRIMPVH